MDSLFPTEPARLTSAIRASYAQRIEISVPVCRPDQLVSARRLRRDLRIDRFAMPRRSRTHPVHPEKGPLV